MRHWGLALVVLLAGCGDGPGSPAKTSSEGGTTAAGSAGSASGDAALAGHAAGGGEAGAAGTGGTSDRGGGDVGGTAAIGGAGGAVSAGGAVGAGGGPPTLCSKSGQPCSATQSCCADAACVLVENLAVCAAKCTTADECQSGCCAPLQAGGGACGPAALCASPCQPFVDCLTAHPLDGTGICGEAQTYLNAATDCELLAGCPAGGCKACIADSVGCTSGWHDALAACDSAAAAAGQLGSSLVAAQHAGATKYCGLP